MQAQHAMPSPARWAGRFAMVGRGAAIPEGQETHHGDAGPHQAGHPGPEQPGVAALEPSVISTSTASTGRATRQWRYRYRRQLHARTAQLGRVATP